MFSKKMLLSSVHQDNSPFPMNTNTNIIRKVPPPFSLSIRTLNGPVPVPVIEKEVVHEEAEKKMKWGSAVWFFFHTLAFKVKESEFPRIKSELLNHIYSICTHLPCPICSDHAKLYLKGINFNAIQTKTQLIDFFFQFHNTVNQRKNYPSFPREDLEQKYTLAITQNMFFNFQRGFQDRSYNPSHINDQYVRNRVLSMFTEWFYKNAHCFDA